MSSFRNLLRRVVPRQVITAGRFVTVLLRGHAHNSHRDGLCIDALGEPRPWLTYPCIEFLSTLDFSGCAVFEYGTGSSTLWWAQRAEKVYGVEREKQWFEKIQKIIPSHAQITLCPNELEYPDAIAQHKLTFDVVVIDGSVRYACMEPAIRHLSERGLIIVDNAEWYPNLTKALRKQGFTQIDFCGFGPINAFASCTSLFFRTPDLLCHKSSPPQWVPVGGRFLSAHDDCPLEQIDRNLLRI
jgi:hypothetical protein